MHNRVIQGKKEKSGIESAKKKLFRRAQVHYGTETLIYCCFLPDLAGFEKVFLHRT